MNQSQAIAKLRKIIGAGFAYRIDPDAPAAEQRDEIRRAWRDAKELERKATAARQARYLELLKTDAEYQRLCAEVKKAEAAASKAGAGMNRHRVMVGRDMGFAFSVFAEGDNWDEVVAKASEKKGV